MGVDSSHVLQQIVIEEHGSSPNGKGVIEVPSPASVFRPDNMSDTWSRSSSQPTDESASSSTPGNPLYRITPCPAAMRCLSLESTNLQSQ